VIGVDGLLFVMFSVRMRFGVQLSQTQCIDRQRAGDDSDHPTQITEVVHHSRASECHVIIDFISISRNFANLVGVDDEKCNQERADSHDERRHRNDAEHTDHGPEVFGDSAHNKPRWNQNDADCNSNPPCSIPTNNCGTYAVGKLLIDVELVKFVLREILRTHCVGNLIMNRAIHTCKRTCNDKQQQSEQGLRNEFMHF